MAQYSTTDFRKNLKIEIDGVPYVIVEANHVKPGKGNAFVKTKYKSLIDGRVLQKNFRSGDTVDRPELESRQMQYLYQDDIHFIFMDNTTYEQLRLDQAAVEEALNFLKDNLEVEVLFHNGNAISLDLPNFVNLTITRTDPGVKGDTAQGGSKPATLETGAVIHVPLYVQEGELVRVDTRTSEYVERVKE
ncbi:MAG: elongation factor P [Myxococcota bacterium]